MFRRRNRPSPSSFRNRKPEQPFRRKLETLEKRWLLSGVTLTVNTANDTHAVSASASPNDASGNISLRSAIEYLNANAAGGDTVNFSLPAGSTINLTLGQIEIDDSLALVGPGAGSLTVAQTSVLPARLFEVGSSTAFSDPIVSMSGLTLTGGRVTGNTMTGEAGAIENYGGLTLSQMTLTHNSSVNALGGAVVNRGSLSVTASTFSNNSAVNGGAIWNWSTVTISDSTFSGNVSYYGGAIFNYSALTVNRSSFAANIATGPNVGSLYSGGAIYNNGGAATIIGSTFSGNTANGDGAGIMLQGGSLNVSNSTFAGNSAGFAGGGIMFYNNTGTATLINSTVANNTAPYGGGIENFVGQFAIANTIVAGNTATTADPDVKGRFANTDHDLIGIIGDATGFSASGPAASLIGTAANPLDPLLGPLANNGGPTETMALLPGSPAINAGDDHPETTTGNHALVAPAADQRGKTRITPADPQIDIGAYEVVQVSPTLSVSDAGGVYTGLPFPATATVAAAGGTPGDSLEGVSPTLTYYAGSTATGTPLAGAPIDAGTYTVVAVFPGSTDYLSASATTTFTISQAPLAISADDQTRVYGAANPTLTVSYQGFVNGETAGVLGGTLLVATPATSASDVGAYPITVSGLTSSNYAITFTDGTLTITKADQTITWSQPADILVGTPLGAAQLDAAVSVVGPAPAGALVYSPGAGTILGAGSNQVLTVTAAATNDYNAATATVSINVLYQFSGFLPPLDHRHDFVAGHTIPIRFALTDAQGDTITSPSAVASLQVAPVNPDGSLGAPFDPQSVRNRGLYVQGGRFEFDWQTAGLAPGAYEIVLTLSDGSVHTMAVQLSAPHGNNLAFNAAEVERLRSANASNAASDSYFQAIAENDDDALSD